MRPPAVLMCWLLSWYYTLKTGAVISGHEYATDTERTPPNVHVLKCQRCGKHSVTWAWDSLEGVK